MTLKWPTSFMFSDVLFKVAPDIVALAAAVVLTIEFEFAKMSSQVLFEDPVLSKVFVAAWKDASEFDLLFFGVVGRNVV